MIRRARARLRVAARCRTPALAFVALALFLVLPGHPLSAIGGLPWGPLALGSAVFLVVGAFATWPVSPSRWWDRIALAAITLALLKLAFATSSPRYGLEARYFANDQFRGLPESST